MKLFVTGATGFIGSHFVNQAIAAGHEVIALRRSPSSKPRIDIPTAPVWQDKALDRLSPSGFEGVDCLVHLAAHTPNVPYDTLENCLHWNVMVPLAVFRSAAAAGVRRFVVAGSCFEYGKSAERYEFIPSDAPLEPVLSYPTSKAAASIAFTSLASELSLKLSIHRIFQVYGEGESENRLWPSLRRAALAGEDFPLTPAEQIRDFIAVDEVAAQLLVACHQEDLIAGQVAMNNLGTGKPQTLRKFCEFWWKHWGAKGVLRIGAIPYRNNDIMRYVPLI
jgi:nucleoside-diphosphate-sugar epimerase